jgi:hypothetical protein
MTTPDIAGLCERLRAVDHDTMFDYPTSTGHLITQAADTLERQAAEIERLRGAQKVLRTSEWEFTGNERASKAFAALRGENND